MTRRRSYRSPRNKKGNIRLWGVERIVTIAGATLYVLGLFGGFHMLEMPMQTAMILLALGGGLLLGLVLSLVW